MKNGRNHATSFRVLFEGHLQVLIFPGLEVLLFSSSEAREALAGWWTRLLG